ncbi:MAG: PAS domain-containing protein [Alphaproteobacteria bacterium]
MSTPAPILRHPLLKKLFAHWRQFATEEGPPLAGDLEPAELRPWLGNLILIDASEEDRFVYAYYSQAFANTFGEDKAGQSLETVPADQRALLKAEYARVRDEAVPVSRVYTADFKGRTMTWERLALPLADDAGEVAKILVAAYPLDR